MEKTGNLLKEVKRRVQSVTYGNPIYKLMLDQGPVPEGISFVQNDPWPGNAAEGQKLLSVTQNLFDEPLDRRIHRGPMGVLRDLRAVGTESARRKAVSLIADAMDHLEAWEEDAWQPEMLAERISAWLSFYDFYISMAPPDFQEHLVLCLTRQFRHLLHLQPVSLTGVAGLKVVKGLIFGGLALVESERAFAFAFDLLRRQLGTEILEDGGHLSRNPAIQLHFLRHLIDIRSILRQTKIEMPPELNLAIERMVPALKMFRHGDGSLGLFQGGGEESSLWLEASLTLAEAKGRATRRLPLMGFERLTAGRSLLLVDVGGAPPRPFDQVAHAGLMSFEFSVGRERLIVNCGAAAVGDDAWRQALAATAAHSTLTLEDTNACEVLPTGLGHRVVQMNAQRFEQDGFDSVEISHDGYAARFNVWHQRTLSLSSDGEVLRGREILAGKTGRDYAVRWHLHPSVQVSLSQSGQAVLLRTPSGSGWRLRAEGGDLSLDASVYCSGDKPRRSLQIKLAGRMQDDPTVLEWSLTREKKAL